MIAVMLGRLGAFWGTVWRARLSALGLHFLAGIILLSVEIAPFPSDPVDVMSIELVDALVPEVAVPEPAPELGQTPSTPQALPDLELPVEPEPPVPEPVQRPPGNLVSAPIAIAPVLPPPEPPVLALEDDEEESINPAYIIRGDPFAEIAPSGAAIASASVVCARTNRETRPTFCSETDDEDARFAALARAQGDFGGYSPRDEMLFAGITFDQYARQNGYETFRDRQFRHRVLGATDGSGSNKPSLNIRRGKDGEEFCSVLQMTIGPSAGNSDGGPVTNGGSKYCD